MRGVCFKHLRGFLKRGRVIQAGCRGVECFARRSMEETDQCCALVLLGQFPPVRCDHYALIEAGGLFVLDHFLANTSGARIGFIDWDVNPPTRCKLCCVLALA